MEFNSDSLDSTVGIKVKTLDLQTHFFRVNTNMPVSDLKEKIKTKIGAPLELQRLLYKGKVLKNDQLLSNLNLEEGDTMHLIVRQSVQSQPTSSTVAADASRAGSSQGARAESSRSTSTIQSDSQTSRNRPSLYPTPTFVRFAQMPFLDENEHTLVPDAVTTLFEYIDQMEAMLRRSGNSWNDGQNQMLLMESIDDFSDTGEQPTPEFLSIVLDQTERLLRENVPTAISHLATRLQRIDSSSNPVLRGQIQYGALELGVVLRHLGAMILELGRVTTCLRMGPTPEESFVRAGPAVYISPTGPNPGIIQQSPFQPSSSSGTNSRVVFRIEQLVPTRSASQVLGSTTSTGGQSDELTLQQPLQPSESDSARALGVQATTLAPNAPSWNALVHSSSDAMHSSTAQGSVSGETQSVMSNSNCPELSRLINESQAMIESNDFDFLKDRPSGNNDGLHSNSENVVGAEDGKQNGSGEKHVSEKAEQQVDLGQAVERFEQNGDPRTIFGELLESSVPVYGDQNVYQDIAELGNDEELANEFMEALGLDIHHRLANESSPTDKS